MQDRLKYNIDSCMAVFQGGGCKAVAYIGAYKAIQQHGIVISEVAGTSAGSIIAALIAVGSSPDDIKRFLDSVNYNEIAKVNFKRRGLWCILLLLACIVMVVIPNWGDYNSMVRILLLIFTCIAILLLLLPLFCSLGYNSTKTLRKELNKELCARVGKTGEKDTVCFKDLYMPLSVVTSDLKHNKEKIFSSRKNPRMNVSRAVCSSCAIPFFFQPISRIFVDGGMVSNSPIHIFAHHPSYHRILNFQLREVSKEGNEKSLRTFLNRLISTIIDGATDIQESFGIRVDHIVIPVQGLTSTSFNNLVKKEIVQKAINTGFETTEQELQKIQEQEIHSLHANALNDELKSYDQLYSLIATYSKGTVSEVVISASDTKWVWHLYPTLIKWANDNAAIYVYYPDNIKTTTEETERQYFLRSLGCSLTPLPELEAKAFLIKVGDQWRGAIYNETFNTDTNQFEFVLGCYYDHSIDGTAIQAWANDLQAKSQKDDSVYKGNVSLQQTDNEVIIKPIQSNCPMYCDADISYKTLKREELEDLLFLTDKVRLYKYRQIGFLFQLHDNKNLSYFSPTKLIRPSKINALIGPIVIEQEDNKDYVVEGHTRLLYAYMNNIKEIDVLYVKNASSRIAIPNDFKPRTIHQLIVSDDKKHDHSNNPNFRHIEAALRKQIVNLPEQV